MTLAEFLTIPDMVAEYRAVIDSPVFRDVVIPILREEFLRPAAPSGEVTEPSAAFANGMNVGAWRMFDGITKLDMMGGPPQEDPRTDYGAAERIEAEKTRRGE